MVDIYDLVQKSLSRNRQGASQFHDPTSEIMMQLPKMIEAEKNKQNVANRASLENIVQFGDMVNDTAGFNKLDSLLNDLQNRVDSTSSLSPYLEIMDKSITDKRGLYNAGLKNLTDIDYQQDAYQLDAQEAEKWPIEKLMEEYEKSLDLQFSMDQTVNNKFTYKTISMTPYRAKKTIDNYVSTLDDAIKYHTQRGHIPTPVAKALAARNFEAAQTSAMRIAQREGDDARSLLRMYDRPYQQIINLERKRDIANTEDLKEQYQFHKELLKAQFPELYGTELPVIPGTDNIDYGAAKSYYSNKEGTGVLDVQRDKIKTYEEMTRIWSPVDIPSVVKDLDSPKKSAFSKEIQALKDEYGYTNPAADDKTQAEQSGNWDLWTDEGKIAAVKWELENPDASIDEMNEQIYFLNKNYTNSKPMPENRVYMTTSEKYRNLSPENRILASENLMNYPDLSKEQIDKMLDFVGGATPDADTTKLSPVDKLKQHANTIKSKNLTEESLDTDTVYYDTGEIKTEIILDKDGNKKELIEYHKSGKLKYINFYEHGKISSTTRLSDKRLKDALKDNEEKVVDKKDANKSYAQFFENEFLTLPASQGSTSVSPRDAVDFKKKYKLNNQSYYKLKSIFDITNRLKTPEKYDEKQIARYEAQLVKLREELQEKIKAQVEFGTWKEIKGMN